ncbi:MAG: surface carbohydrate biosynthesis protein [Desulfovibrio sp.]
MYATLPIEVLNRELDGRIYFALKLLQRDIPSIMGNKTAIHDYVTANDDFFLWFDKGVYHKLLDYYKTLIAKGGTLLEIREEWGVSADENNLAVKTVAACLPYFEEIYGWGELPVERTKELAPKELQYKFHKTGVPSFDLFHQPYWQLYEKLAEKKPEIPEGCILMNANYALYNCAANIEGLSRLNDGLPDEEEKKKQDHYKIIYKKQEKDFKKFISLARTLSSAFPERTIVVRPHPVEELKRYTDLLGDRNNIRISKEGSVRLWIAKAAAVVHKDCTTGIEAYMAGKPVFSYRPGENSKYVAWLPVSVSTVVNTEDELTYALREEFASPVESSRTKEKDNYLRKYVASIDFLAVDKILDDVEKKLPQWKKGKNDNPPMKSLPVAVQIKRCLRMVKIGIRNLFSDDVDAGVRTLQQSKFGGIDPRDIELRIRILREIDPSLPNVKLTEVTEDLYLFEKK